MANAEDCDDTNPDISLTVWRSATNSTTTAIRWSMTTRPTGSPHTPTRMGTAGDDTTETLVCTVGPDAVTNGDDCDDTNPDISPDGVEICNELDDDCDTSIDEGAQIDQYMDADGDGVGGAVVTHRANYSKAM